MSSLSWSTMASCSARRFSALTNYSFKNPSFVLRNAFQSSNSFTRTRAAAFHTSKKFNILPAGPQVIEGDVNQPVVVPPPNPVHGSYHWSFERLVSVALVPLTIAPFAAGSLNPVTDAILGATIVIHSHIGFESILIDYIPRKKHPLARKLFIWILRASTVTVLVGLYEFQTNDVGITEAVKRIWRA